MTIHTGHNALTTASAGSPMSTLVDRMGSRIYTGRRRCLPIACTLALAMVSASAGAPVHGQAAPMSCGMPSAGTRWLAESYTATHTYGLGDDEWIESYGGLAAAGDSVFFYDQLGRRIVRERPRPTGRVTGTAWSFRMAAGAFSGWSTCRRCRRTPFLFRSGRCLRSERLPSTAVSLTSGAAKCSRNLRGRRFSRGGGVSSWIRTVTPGFGYGRKPATSSRSSSSLSPPGSPDAL